MMLCQNIGSLIQYHLSFRQYIYSLNINFLKTQDIIQYTARYLNGLVELSYFTQNLGKNLFQRHTKGKKKTNSKQSKLKSILFSVDEKNNLTLCLDSMFFFLMCKVKLINEFKLSIYLDYRKGLLKFEGSNITLNNKNHLIKFNNKKV